MSYTRKIFLASVAALSLTLMGACSTAEKEVAEPAETETVVVEETAQSEEVEEVVVEEEEDKVDADGFVDGWKLCTGSPESVELRAVDTPATLSAVCPDGWVLKDGGFNTLTMQAAPDTRGSIKVKVTGKEEHTPGDGNPISFSVGGLDFEGTEDSSIYDVVAVRDGWYYAVFLFSGPTPGDPDVEAVLGSLEVK